MAENVIPRISSFHGVDVYIYYNDHVPPHFHAMGGDDEVLIQFNPPQVYQGGLPRGVLRKVMQWAALHPTELDDDWQLARSG